MLENHIPSTKLKSLIVAKSKDVLVVVSGGQTDVCVVGGVVVWMVVSWND